MSFDPTALSRCVGCGLCLPACPTFQITHAEPHGPRGRIAGMRLVDRLEIDAGDAAYLESMATCVQCRACEPACPSNVPFGLLMEQAREAMHEQQPSSVLAQRATLRRKLADLALAALTHPFLLRMASVALSLAQALRIDRVLPARWRVARRLPLRNLFLPLRATSGHQAAHLFRGCVMDAWFRPTHQATLRVLAAAGYATSVEPAGLCCGALHLHAGRAEQARALARRVVAAYAHTTGPIVVNSAGCGAALKEYDRLLGTEEARAFSARVRDFAELVARADLPPLRALDTIVVYQAACHLKNVQRVDAEPEALLRRIPALRVLRPRDGELCCGAGGAYSLVQPQFATRMREARKQALLETGAHTAVSGNPGCILHLEAAGLSMTHIADLLASALPTAYPES